MGGEGGKGRHVPSPLQLAVWGKTQKRQLCRWVRGVLGPGGEGTQHPRGQLVGFESEEKRGVTEGGRLGEGFVCEQVHAPEDRRHHARLQPYRKVQG